MNDPTIALHGVTALASMSILPAGRRAAVSSGAPAVIVDSMRAHPGDPGIAQCGCDALTNVASLVPAGKLAVAAAGGDSAIATAFECHDTVVAIPDYGTVETVEDSAQTAAGAFAAASGNTQVLPTRVLRSQAKAMEAKAAVSKK